MGFSRYNLDLYQTRENIMAKAVKAPEQTTTTTRAFRVDPHIIRTLIGNQAGSLQKAVMEAISNSMDAGAKAINLTVNDTQVIISDNGKGLTEKSEILAFFEVFGFDHTDLGREHGRFGVGRGQLFYYGKNTWRTGKFSMGVDINHTGLDYDLVEGLPAATGMTISIDLYEPMSVGDRYRFDEAFRKLVKYAAIPIVYNGEQINDDPRKKKWDHETDEAWFQVRQNGNLSVYSQGLLVQEMSSYQHGVGGVVVTKPGHALALNMARNDILAQECGVWKAVVKDLRKLAAPFRDKAERQNTLTAEQRKHMALETLEVEDSSDLKDLYDKPLFTLTNGKHLSLAKLLQQKTWAVGPSHDKVGDKAIQMSVGYAITPESLDRFGVDTLEALKKRVIQTLERCQKKAPKKPKGKEVMRWDRSNPQHQVWQDYYAAQNDYEAIARKLADLRDITTHETTDVFKDLIKTDFEEIPVHKLAEDEKAMLYAIRKAAVHVRIAVDKAEGVSPWGREARTERKIMAMKSDSMNGCTNGTSMIWINERYLKKPGRGLVVFADIANLLAHEYTHGDSSQISHGHDHTFFESFHNTVRHGEVTKASIIMMGRYAKSSKTKPTATLLSELDQTIDFGGELVFQGERPTLEDETKAEPATPKPKRRPRVR